MKRVLKKHIEKIYYSGILGIPLLILTIGGIWPETSQAWVFIGICTAIYLIGVYLMRDLLLVYRELENTKEKIMENSDELEIISSIIARDSISILKSNFNIFRKSLKVKEYENQNGEIIHKFFRIDTAENYFEEESLINKNIRSRTINHIAQSLTGVGIFGTFLGIVNGLKDLNFTDSVAMQSGIETLLNGVKLSFSTSLYGILFSIIIIYAFKICSDLVMKSSYDLIKILDERIEIYSEENGVDNIVIELKKQSGIYEKLATDMAEEMGRRFNESLEENMNCLSENLSKVIVDMGDGFNKSMVESLNSNIEVLTSSMAPVLLKLDSTMTEIVKHQETSSDKFITEMMGSFKETLNINAKDEADKLKDSMGMISEKNSEMISSFTEAMERMQNLVHKQEELMENSTNSAKSMTVATGNMSDLQSEFTTLIESIKNVNKTNELSVENVNKIVSMIIESTKKQAEINKELGDMINKSTVIVRTQDEAVRKSQIINTNFESSLGTIKNSIEELNTNVFIYKNAFKDIKNSTVEVVEDLNKNYKGITENLEDINEKFNRTLDKVNSGVGGIVTNMIDVSRELKNNHEKMNLLTENMGTFAEAEKMSQELWIGYKEKFEGLNETITDGVERYTQEVAKGTNELLTEYDKHIAEAINSLRKTVEELTYHAEEISDAVEEIRKEGELLRE